MFILAVLLSLTALPSPLVSATCASTQRLASAAQIPYAYNLSPLGASAKAFEAIPFARDCQTSIAANGAPPLPVAIDGNTTITFAVATRQLFSLVMGDYTDFATNGTTDIIANVTLGVRDIIPIPVTFSANVYLDFNSDCEIKAVRAFAQIPTAVLGLILNPPGVPAGIL